MITRLPVVTDITTSDDRVDMCFSHDPERTMLPAFAQALLKYARCANCDTPLKPDFSPCHCGHKNLEPCWSGEADCSVLRVEGDVWRDVIEPLWKKDRRRVHSIRKRERRAQAIKDSGEPTYTATDIACLRKAQGDACYYCGVAIHAGAQIEHLTPLTLGGSNGFVNIMLACAPCNTAKHSLTEQRFWTKLRKQLPGDEFDRRRSAAKEMKKAKWRILRAAARMAV